MADITDDEIRAMRAAADAAGDTRIVRLCDAAFNPKLTHWQRQVRRKMLAEHRDRGPAN